MATTTPNFGWAVPTSTDLVKDGAVAIETLGDSIDASLVDLKGGTTNQVLAKNSNTDMDFKWVSDATGMTNPMTTTGDTIYSSSGSTPARLGIGSSGQVLTVAAGVPSWATPSGGGGITQISSATMSGNSITLSSIPGTYKNLQIQLTDYYTSANVTEIRIRLNGITAIDYSFGNVATGVSTVAGSGAIQTDYYSFGTTTRTSAGNYGAFSTINLMDYTSTIPKFIQGQGYGTGTGGDAKSFFNAGSFFNAAAITSIEVYLSGATTFGGGTIKLFGVN